jgi:hypothetical protein
MELKLDGLDDTINVCTVLPATFDTNIFQNGANYTGQQVQAIEPVYDPTYAAKNIFLLAQVPRREIFIGPAGRLLAKQNVMMPHLYEAIVSRFTRRNGFSKAPQFPTSGNLYEPIEMHSGVHGGWRQVRLRADHLNLMVGAGVGVLALATLAGYLVANTLPDKEDDAS